MKHHLCIKVEIIMNLGIVEFCWIAIVYSNHMTHTIRL